MEVFIDDDRTNRHVFDQGNVEEALQHIQSGFRVAGQVVVGLRCDGDDIASDAMTATLQQPVSDFERLEVFTSTKGALVGEAMGEAATALDDTERECQRAAELLNEGRTVEGTETLGECLRVWQQVHEAVGKSIEMLGLNVETATINGEPLAEIIGKPKDVLLQIKEALIAQDYVLLADILQYELGQVAEQWRTTTAWLRQEAAQAPNTAMNTG